MVKFLFLNVIMPLVLMFHVLRGQLSQKRAYGQQNGKRHEAPTITFRSIKCRELVHELKRRWNLLAMTLLRELT